MEKEIEMTLTPQERRRLQKTRELGLNKHKMSFPEGVVMNANCVAPRGNLMGQRFGKLVVTNRYIRERIPCGDTIFFWECICDCGKRCWKQAKHLRQGDTRSCGCLKKEPELRSKGGRYERV